MIYTANIAGGDNHTHRTMDSAARRIARGDGPHGGYVISRMTGIHSGQAARMNKIIESVYAEQTRNGQCGGYPGE